MFNGMLVISLIALTAAAAFLVSDILSFNSNNSPTELFSVFSFLNPLESEPVKNPVMAMADNSSLKDAGMPQSPLNRSDEEKRALADDDIPETQTDPKSLKNSSLSQASISTRQLSGTIKAQSKPLSDDSPKPSTKKKHKSSSKSSLQGTKVGASASILAGKTAPTLSQSRDRVNLSNDGSQNYASTEGIQSQGDINLSDKPSMSLSPFESEINMMEGPNNLSSQNNLSSTYDIDLESAANSSAESNVSEFGPADNEASNRKVDSAISQGEEAEIVPLYPVSNPTNSISSDDTDDNGDLGDASLNNVIPSEDSFEPQHLQSDMTDGAKEPASIAETLTSTPLSGPEEDETVDSDSSETQKESSTQEDSRVVPSSKFSSKSQNAKKDQINKRSKTARGPKRTAPSAKPAKTRPTRPSRDRDRSRH